MTNNSSVLFEGNINSKQFHYTYNDVVRSSKLILRTKVTRN